MDGAGSEHIHLAWEARIRLLGNPMVWRSILLAFGIPSVLFGFLVAAITRRLDYALLVPAALLAGLLALYLVIAAVIDLFGGFRVIFMISSLGVRSLSGKGAKAAGRAAFLAGVLAGRPGAMGAGLLAESEADILILWPEITRIEVNLRRRFILIKRGWGWKPIGLYPTADNLQEVLDLLRRFRGDLLPG
jgi:hypothetical protein